MPIRQANEGLPQKQLSKEFVRQWLICKWFSRDLMVKHCPKWMLTESITSISERYIELYENITGLPFEKASLTNLQDRIHKNVSNYLQNS